MPNISSKNDRIVSMIACDSDRPGIHVGFNAYLLTSPSVRGWTRYTINLVAALTSKGVRPFLYSTGPIHTDHLNTLPASSFEIRIAPPMRYSRWETCWLPRQLKADNIDLFHSPINYGLPWRTHCPRVLTFHDAIDELYYFPRLPWRDKWRLTHLRTRIRNWTARNRADHIITVSKHARDDIVERLHVSSERVSVIYEAADPVFRRPLDPAAASAVRRKWQLTKPYILYLGGWESRKNLPFLVQAFADARLQSVELVLAGGNDAERSAIIEQATNLNCHHRLRLIGFVPNEDLPAIYDGAITFVYPSAYEGFGLQLVEAMAMSCPILAANATCLPEVLGQGGDIFNLQNPAELTLLLRRIATDDLYRTELVKRSAARSTSYSWESTASQTVDIYRSLLEGTHGP